MAQNEVAPIFLVLSIASLLTSGTATPDLFASSDHLRFTAATPDLFASGDHLRFTAATPDLFASGDHLRFTEAYRFSGNPAWNQSDDLEVESAIWEKMKPYCYSNSSNPEAEFLNQTSPATPKKASHWWSWLKPVWSEFGIEADGNHGIEAEETTTTNKQPIIVAPVEFCDPFGAGRAVLRRSGYSVFAQFFDFYRLNWFRKQSLVGGITIFAPNDRAMSTYSIKGFSEFSDLFPAHVIGQKVFSKDLGEDARFQTLFAGYELVCTDYFNYIYGDEHVEEYRHLVNKVGVENPDLCTVGDWLIVHGVVKVLVPPEKTESVIVHAMVRRLEER